MSGSVEEKLYEAAEDGRVSAVSSLLRHPEINVNWTNEDHWTPLHAASWNGHVEVVKLLLAHPNIDVNVRNEYGETPLSLGCEYGHVSVVEVLLKDPRVDLTLDDIDGCTPLWWASYEGHHKVIESLLASGRDLGDVREYTTLEITREKEKHREFVSVLERFVANPTLTRRKKLNFKGLLLFPFSFFGSV